MFIIDILFDISFDDGEKVDLLMTWVIVPSGTPMGRALSGNSCYDQVYGTLRVAGFGIKYVDPWEEDRNGINLTQTCGVGCP